MRTRAFRLLSAATAALLTGCGTDVDPSGFTPNTVVETIGDTTVVRTLSGSVWGTEAILEVAYEARYASTPIELDVGPWSSGPLAGQTLFGIVELQGPDRFRVDFEPAGPDSDGAERPATFSEQTVTFVRKVN